MCETLGICSQSSSSSNGFHLCLFEPSFYGKLKFFNAFLYYRSQMQLAWQTVQSSYRKDRAPKSRGEFCSGFHF